MCGTGDRCYAGPGKKQKIERKNFQGRVPKELSILRNFSCSSPPLIPNTLYYDSQSKLEPESGFTTLSEKSSSEKKKEKISGERVAVLSDCRECARVQRMSRAVLAAAAW